MRHEPVRRAFGSDLLGRFAERRRLGLGEDICQKQVMMPPKRINRLSEGNEVTRDEPGPLVNQLVEGMLAVCSRLTPIDWPGIIIDPPAVERDMLAIALLRQL